MVHNKKSVTFHMAQITSSKGFKGHKFSGPLLDYGAPYNGIGMDELKLTSPYLRTNWNHKLLPLPESVPDKSHWQYGSGSHSSDSRPMLGSVIVTACLDDGTTVNIKHVVIEGSSQSKNGRNLDSKCDIIHTDGNYLKIVDGVRILLENIDLHSYLPFSLFIGGRSKHCYKLQAQLFCATGNPDDSKPQRPWYEMKKIIDKVHKHVCGHASLSDMKILLE